MIFPTDSESANWQIVFKSGEVVQAELIKNEIENNDIKCFILNKKDSLYPMFGVFQLYVAKEDMNIAKVIIDAFLNNNDSEIK